MVENFILDKETLKIYKNLTDNCEPVEVLKKTLCKKCDNRKGNCKCKWKK